MENKNKSLLPLKNKILPKMVTITFGLNMCETNQNIKFFLVGFP